MKLFKFFYIFFIFSLFLYLIFEFNQSNSLNAFNPSTDKNFFYDKLHHALSISQIKTNNYIYRDFINEVEFSNNNGTTVIFSTNLSPYFQINTLQHVLKKAKIDNKTPRLINISAVNPYATF